jgi:hypothetical protein
MHQVGLAQAHATVDEKRVVQMPWHVGYMHGGGARHAVGEPSTSVSNVSAELRRLR